MKFNQNILESIEPSDRAIKNICQAKKFCSAQGKITFGQLKSLVTNAKVKKLLSDVGEGGYKATIRILPWFLPQLILAGFTGSVLRAFNKVFRPAIEDTEGYKTWWGKTVTKLLNLVEGELGLNDPLSRIFFISDGLLTMLDKREKIKFARYIAEIADKKPNDEEVPEFFVENELRKWLNEKFLLDPPLPQKEIEIEDDDLPFDEIKEGNIKKRRFSETINENELKWHFDEKDRKVKIIKSNGWQIQMDNKLPITLKEGSSLFIPKGVYHRIIKGSGNLIVEVNELDNKNLIVESNKYRREIRRIIRDIINVFKNNDEGEFYLPDEETSDDIEYDIPKLGAPITVELLINIDNDIDDFKVNAEYYSDEDTIAILINYNPKNKRVILYSLVGALNETLAHELRHHHQNIKGIFNLPSEEKEDPYEYYTQEHELDALNFGFKRLSKLSKKPLEVVVKNWFDENEDIHNLTPSQANDVIKKVLNYKK